ncbi:MAG: hypothetical protein COU11_01975 [Candidatus Harrisonbacteria bacterium CG10_big_fil_rev_8_21_14_0_10_49_15]|uniref:HTH merR-type domain-containing protein n=1 Tax=Candidatus Harrisonbacteria bacterium CG10_big_fil_rev_8_21_14_0_10_49_15 TaxID=1974587 RepID=A0A2H0UL83_9BACT|nr:MAG: hypothetical protein COU11_01975 [Candidatus Harrisonbacteria bacterium CG10_big_fil_rev_8_21_14_0_10_49_15]
MQKYKNLLKIGEVAALLGVSIDTLRRWDRQGRLKPSITKLSGHRLYDHATIRAMVSDPVLKIEQWAKTGEKDEVLSRYYCSNRAVFGLELKDAEEVLQAQVDEQTTPPAIIGAILGELGNNAFDHNLGNWPDEPGVYFCLDSVRRKAVVADRGQGLLKTLRQARPTIADDSEALLVAFTEILSGRAPEDRGNGLKFVRSMLKQYRLGLSFQSGSALVSIGPLSDRLDRKVAEEVMQGCFAILEY